MAIDSVRLLSDSAAQIWRRLNLVHPLEIRVDNPSFETWIGAGAHKQLDHAEEQALRREYRRLQTLIDEIEFLVRSRPKALQLISEQLGER